MYSLVQIKRATPVFLFALALFGLSTASRAVSPPPDGGYFNETTAEGDNALLNLTTGTDNTAAGFDALSNDTSGFNNTAIGAHTLQENTTGSFNTANGQLALFANMTGNNNTAIGEGSLFANATGGDNTAIGTAALGNNHSGFANTAVGLAALIANTTGNDNTANGEFALADNTTGNGNTALGKNAGHNLTTGSNNIDIGDEGVAGESNTIRVGKEGTQTNTYIAGIYATPVVRGLVVKVDSRGQLGTVGSSVRFKEKVRPMDKASEAILALKPITFRYKKEIDPEGTPQFGLLAEDVEKVNPDLVVWDAEGKVYSVRYEVVNAMLLNEFLKEHKTVQEQGAIIARQQKQIEALTAGLQKVSAQLEVSKSAPQMALINR
jgi:endosialidase-like protein